MIGQAAFACPIRFSSPILSAPAHAATGDFVLVKEEVDGVTKALAEHGILVTALHNHLVHGTPDLYFMHFWVHDSADKVTKGLRAGLDAMKQSKKES